MFSPVDWGWFIWLELAYLACGVGVAVLLTVDWYSWYYSDLKKAPWHINVPGWVYAAVWFVLYSLRGVASQLVWRSPTSASGGIYEAAVAMALVVLAFNAAWVPIFFGARMIRLALLVLFLAWAAAIVHCVLAFFVYIVAGALLVAEPVVLTYALTLNLYVVFANDVVGRHHTLREQAMTEISS